MRSGVDDQRLAARVLDLHGPGHGIMGVPAEYGVDARDHARHLDIDVHAVVREHDDRVGALAARLVDDLLHALVADAHAPLRDLIARIGDRRVGEGLAHDGHRYPVHLLDDVGLEDRLAPVLVQDVLGDEIDLALEVVVDDLHHAVRAEGELPVGSHHVDAEQELGVDHVLGVGPQ